MKEVIQLKTNEIQSLKETMNNTSLHYHDILSENARLTEVVLAQKNNILSLESQVSKFQNLQPQQELPLDETIDEITHGFSFRQDQDEDKYLNRSSSQNNSEFDEELLDDINFLRSTVIEQKKIISKMELDIILIKRQKLNLDVDNISIKKDLEDSRFEIFRLTVSFFCYYIKNLI